MTEVPGVDPDDCLPPLVGPVELVGTGLIGTSVALVCRRLGLEVVLRDTSAEHVRTATGLGAAVVTVPEEASVGWGAAGAVLAARVWAPVSPAT